MFFTRNRALLFLLTVFIWIMAAACGEKENASTETGTFGEAQAASVSPGRVSQGDTQPSASPVPQKEQPGQQAEAGSATANSSPAGASATPAASVSAAAPASPAPETAASSTTMPEPAAKPAAVTGKSMADAPAPSMPAPQTSGADTVKKEAEQPKPSSSPAAEPAGGTKEIHWSKFFDDDKQNQPSEAFWDMNGQTVSIKGYMGEVLSFEKNWFLVIPSPGAECPFDNGDETFWNKIMIAFTDKGEKLRHTSGPLRITGRLDVGIKVDESGYKTMFRLYEAKFEKLKE